MEAFKKVVEKLKCHPSLIFWYAVNYIEWRIPKERLGVYFMQWTVPAKEEDTYYLQEVPQFVEDYCIDVLAGRAEALAIIDTRRKLLSERQTKERGA